MNVKAIYSTYTTFTLLLAFAFSPLAYSQTASLGGRVQTSAGDNVTATITLSSSTGSVLASVNTLCDDGTYLFEGLPTGATYYLGVTKVDDFPSNQALNGISTFDLVLVSRFILGFSTPTIYEQLAADTDGDGSFSVLDILLMRRLILGIVTSWNTPTWRFVRPNTGNALSSFPVSLQGDVSSFDFVAVKVGDINLSAVGCE